MGSLDKNRLVHRLFLTGVIIKAIDGVLELAGGVSLAFASSERIQHLVDLLTRGELSEDPRDRIANYLFHALGHLSAGTKNFATAYLLVHGAIKVGLVAGLLLRRRLAYPVAIIAFVLFVVYQLYRYAGTGAPSLLVLSVVDVFVIVLTWLEYVRLKDVGGFAHPHSLS